MLMISILVLGLAWIAAKAATPEQQAANKIMVDRFALRFFILAMILAAPLWLAIGELALYG